MNPKHSNPTLPRRDKDGNEIWTRAPYNFVPLPEKTIPAREPLNQDAYYDEGLTGWIECELETCSPTYVRGMMTVDAFQELGNKKPDKLTPEEKERLAPFFATTEIEVEGYLQPVIPGSSLRGMVRTLVEIAGYGRMRWVGREPTFTFRAVAASKDDPLRDPYQDVLGRFGSNVRAGYLEQEGDDWYVQPALTPTAMGWPEKSPYLKVKEWQIKSEDILGYLRLDSPDYRPQLHKVSFDVEFRSGEQGRYVSISQIGSREAGYKYKGVLVCSGNMMETAHKGQKVRRRNHALVLAHDEKARRLKIRLQVVEDYLAGLTPFQKEKLTDWGSVHGCLKHGTPVFYVERGNEVICFGHSPNFRIPARLFGGTRAATPLDFVPAVLRSGPRPDLADAIFGWVEEAEMALKDQRAGRVFFSDAHFVGAKDGVWLRPEPITPHTLSGPKPTTFQHYLVQDRQAGHDPDNKKSLAHYGTSPDQTRIRGHKLYWHKGVSPDIEATAKEREHEQQLTRIMPLKPGVQFSFRIHFENLREEELGALLWTLTLPGERGKLYRHKLGMGKPLGMGAVVITPDLYLTDRHARYSRLFGAAAWDEAVSEADAQPYVDVFEKFVLKEGGIAPAKNRLAEVERIRMLLALLEWRESDATWLETTRYMEIEHGPDKVNEYKERPVLPDPLAALAGQPVRPPVTEQERRAPQPPRRVDSKPLRVDGAPSNRLTGTVKWFNDGKGYGFIERDDGGPDAFVHYTDIGTSGRKSLEDGQRVTFTVVEEAKGPRAKDVQVI